MKTIWDIQDTMGFKKDESDSKFTRYEGTFSTGAFDGAGDYEAGILGVMVGPYHNGSEEYLVYLTIYTIDDGGWQAMQNLPISLEDANKTVDDIIKKWEWDTKLPTAKELNEFLMEFKMWGEVSC